MTETELLAYRDIIAAVKDIEGRIRSLKLEACSPKGMRYSGTPGGSTPLSAQQKYIEGLEALSELYEEEKAKLMGAQIAIERAIASLPLELRRVIEYRCIDCLTWQEISKKTGFSTTWLRRRYSDALELLEKVS